MAAIPLFARIPGRAAASIPDQVSLLDLVPTFTDYGGTTVPGAPGLSLTTLLTDP